MQAHTSAKDFFRRSPLSTVQSVALAAGLALLIGLFGSTFTSQIIGGAGHGTGPDFGSSNPPPGATEVAGLFGGASQEATTPTPKPAPQAAEDLKRNPPLDITKIGDPMPRNLFVELSKLINPAVVSISTSQVTQQLTRRQMRDPMREFLEDFWGMQGGPGGRQEQPPAAALGSGFIIRADGLIITNNHVVENGDSIKVQLDAKSNQFYQAEVIGRDQRTDIALIKIDAKRQLPVAPLGDSKSVQVGEWVAAFGNPYGHAHTMTKGIVSAIGREIGELNRFPFIQTDASINPGNSGGPLVNTQGYVIGVNTAIDARAQGIGFAIPIDNVKTIIAQLEKDGRVRRGFIGVNLSPIPPEYTRPLGLANEEGVLVTQVMPGSPAEAAGIQPYDIITEFNGKKTPMPYDLQNAVSDIPIGAKATTKVIRFVNNRKTEKTMTVTIAENPEEKRPRAEKPAKRYLGQKAPFDLGFKVSDLTPQLRQELGLQGAPQVPVIIEVERGSIAGSAGLQAGDIILDVNRQAVKGATDVVRRLHQGTNLLRIARGDLVAIVVLEQRRGG